jgi:ABC-type polysaccharide/polyol phosphate export permease
VLFFATPVFYPIEAAPQALAQLLMINPIALIIVEARNALGLAEDTAAEAIGGAGLLAIPVAITFGVPALAVWIFRRQRNVAERL